MLDMKWIWNWIQMEDHASRHIKNWSIAWCALQHLRKGQRFLLQPRYLVADRANKTNSGNQSQGGRNQPAPRPYMANSSSCFKTIHQFASRQYMRSKVHTVKQCMWERLVCMVCCSKRVHSCCYRYSLSKYFFCECSSQRLLQEHTRWWTFRY